MLAERLLQWVKRFDGSEALHGLDLRPVGLDREGEAGASAVTVEEDGAGAADPVLAPDVGAGQPEVLAQEVHQQAAGLHGSFVDGSVHGDPDGLGSTHYGTRLREGEGRRVWSPLDTRIRPMVPCGTVFRTEPALPHEAAAVCLLPSRKRGRGGVDPRGTRRRREDPGRRAESRADAEFPLGEPVAPRRRQSGPRPLGHRGGPGVRRHRGVDPSPRESSTRASCAGASRC